MVLLITAIILFLAGLVAAHEGDLFSLTATEYICLASVCFVAAHLPFDKWIRR